MASSRVLTAIVGLAASIVLSVVLWRAFGTPIFFLFVPFVPFLLRGRNSAEGSPPTLRACPDCGFETRDPRFEYCPRDGTRLVERRRD